MNVTHVPYRGLGPAMQDLIAGRVQYICDSVSTSKPQIEGGHVKANRHHRAQALAGAAERSRP